MKTVNIELNSFENDIADFNVGFNGEVFTAWASIGFNDLFEFMEGCFIIEPYAWFDMNEDQIDKPEWFKRNELFKLNQVFEDNFKKFM